MLIALWVTTGLAVVCMGALPWMLNHRGMAEAPQTIVAQDSGLPVLFDAPSFSLTDENGKPFDSSQLE